MQVQYGKQMSQVFITILDALTLESNREEPEKIKSYVEKYIVG